MVLMLQLNENLKNLPRPAQQCLTAYTEDISTHLLARSMCVMPGGKQDYKATQFDIKCTGTSLKLGPRPTYT